MTLGPKMDQSWEPIVLVTLTAYPSGNEVNINLQSIEALETIPAQDERPPSDEYLVNLPAVPEHTIVYGKSGTRYTVKESYGEIMRLAVELMNKAIGR